MREYIEREALFRFLTEQKDKETGAYSKGRNAGLDVARSALHNREITPAADVVEVVRCKDCRRGEVDGPEYDPDLYFCQLGCGLNKGHFFCAFGERRAEDG